MVQAQELEIQTPQLRVNALAWGPAEGRPTLALHGWLDNADSYDGLGPLLAEAGLRLVSLDLPGHGLSQHKAGVYHFVDWVGDVLAVADALGWERFTLIGHSMGAGISTLLAGTVPQRLQQLVLLEGLGPMSEGPEHAAKRLARSLRSEARKSDAEDRKRLYADTQEAVDRLSEATGMDASSAATLVARGLLAVDGGWTWRADPKLRVDSRLRLTEEHVHVFLRAISCPTLVVRADRGWPTDPAIMRGRLDCIGDHRLVELSGRHHVHLDEPALVAASLLPFLREFES